MRWGLSSTRTSEREITPQRRRVPHYSTERRKAAEQRAKKKASVLLHGLTATALGLFSSLCYGVLYIFCSSRYGMRRDKRLLHAPTNGDHCPSGLDRFGYNQKPASNLKRVVLTNPSQRTQRRYPERVSPDCIGGRKGAKFLTCIIKITSNECTEDGSSEASGNEVAPSNDATHTHDRYRSGGVAAAQPCEACRGMFEECSNAVRTSEAIKGQAL